MRKPKLNLTQALEKATTERNLPAAAQGDKTGRNGKKLIGAFFDPAVSRQLRSLAVDLDTTVQALMAEALNEVFAKHGKPRIAQ